MKKKIFLIYIKKMDNISQNSFNLNEDQKILINILISERIKNSYCKGQI